MKTNGWKCSRATAKNFAKRLAVVAQSNQLSATQCELILEELVKERVGSNCCGMVAGF